VFQGGNGVSWPVATLRPPPVYTADAMRARLQGTVFLKCIVRPDGVCSDIRIARSLDATMGLDQQAIESAKRWRFRPGMRQGEPVAVEIDMAIEFNIR
jgi:periplasmic protein TonB